MIRLIGSNPAPFSLRLLRCVQLSKANSTAGEKDSNLCVAAAKNSHQWVANHVGKKLFRRGIGPFGGFYLLSLLCLVLSGCDGSGVEVGDGQPNQGPSLVGSNSGAPSPSGAVALNETSRSAARFLMQASFGPTEQSIAQFVSLGRDAWLQRQFSLPASTTYAYTRANSNGSNRAARHRAWWNNVLQGEDQLRQRVAFALSQIFVVSDVDRVLANRQYGMSHYYDMLAQNAFGNYRELLEQVTLHPAMGVYLTHIRSEKANPVNNVRPDENYAREVLQLFSTGLNVLQQNGTMVMQQGQPVPVYSQRDVEDFARVFTGWNYATASSWDSTNLQLADFEQPMVPFDTFHDFGSKQLLNGAVLPAGQGARQDLEMALDNIFQHANVGPYFSRLLIQRLVTSNPSSGYVSRVAAVFNNNGAGQRGDLRAVVRAILIDDEARNASIALRADYGKVREPVIRLAHIWRGLLAETGTDANGIHRHADLDLERLDEMTGQAVMRSPSVFNFYQADTPISPNDNLVAPEMQITTEANVATTHVNYHHQLYRFTTRTDLGSDNHRVTLVNLDRAADLARNSTDLMDWIDLVFFAGQMPDYIRDNIQGAIRVLPSNSAGRFSRAQDALFMAFSSPAFAVQQ